MIKALALALAGVCLAASLTGCEDKAAAPIETAVAPAEAQPAATAPAALMGFGTTGAPPTGYFSSEREIKVGNLQFTSLAIGGADEFKTWEAGTRTDTYAPVMVMFDDVSSPMVAGELGEHHERMVRVLPSAYEVGPGRVRFSGTGEGVGSVMFDGTVDEAAFTKASAEGAADGTLMTGTLTIGGQTFADVPFNWSVGD